MPFSGDEMSDSYIHAAADALSALASRGRPVAIMDSGVGGLPYLAAVRALLPGESFVYLADRAGFPYGTKSREEIEATVLDCVSRLIGAFDPKAVVIACNTASQAALAAVRERFPSLPIIGTVPAVKPAAERTHSRVIGVLASEHAIADPYLGELIARHAPNDTVIREAAQDLVSFVERDFVDSSEEDRREAVFDHVSRLISGGADEIVLSCTHFLHVSKDIESVANDLARRMGRSARVEVIDSRDGVARRLKDVLSERGIMAVAQGRDSLDGVFLLSGPPPFEKVYASFAARYSLAGPFSLDEG